MTSTSPPRHRAIMVRTEPPLRCIPLFLGGEGRGGREGGRERGGGREGGRERGGGESGSTYSYYICITEGVRMGGGGGGHCVRFVIVNVSRGNRGGRGKEGGKEGGREASGVSLRGAESP